MLSIKIWVLLSKKGKTFITFGLRDDSHKVTKVRSKRKTIGGTSKDEEMEANEMTSSLVPWRKINLEQFPLTLPDIGKHKDVFAVLLRTLKR